MKTIRPSELHSLMQSSQQLRLLDVRTPGEFHSVHIEGSVLHPVDGLDPTRAVQSLPGNGEIYVICHSGSRAKRAAAVIEQAKLGDCVVLEGGIESWQQLGGACVQGESKVLPLPRQMQIIMGSLVVSSVALAHLVNPSWIWLAGFIGCGLLMAGLTDFCPARTLLAKAPWNNRPAKSNCSSNSCCC